MALKPHCMGAAESWSQGNSDCCIPQMKPCLVHIAANCPCTDVLITQCGDAQEMIVFSVGAAWKSRVGLLCHFVSGTESLLQPSDDRVAHLQMSNHFSHEYTIIQPCQGSATVQDVQFMLWWHGYQKPDSNKIYTLPTRIKHKKCYKIKQFFKCTMQFSGRCPV